MTKPKPPTDYWIWLAVAAVMLTMIGYCCLSPHPLERMAPPAVSTQRAV